MTSDRLYLLYAPIIECMITAMQQLMNAVPEVINHCWSYKKKTLYFLSVLLTSPGNEQKACI